LDATDDEGSTALMIAAALGRDELALLLLKAGADTKATNKRGETALDIARRSGPPASAILAALQAEDKAAMEKALIRAIRSNSTGDVTSLIERGANVNAKDEEGATPLMIAAGMGRVEMVKLLLSKGADVNARDNSGVTALGWAYAPPSDADVPLAVRREMVQILKQFGARSGAIVGLD
jgi:ankyrin repeat protein